MKPVNASVAIGGLALPTGCSGVRECRYTASPISRAQLSLIQPRQAPCRQGKATRHSLSLHAAEADGAPAERSLYDYGVLSRMLTCASVLPVESVIELEVKVSGLQCGGCVDRVVEALLVFATNPG